MQKDIVIFRKDKYGVFALFPEIPSDRNGYLCTSYQHVGQHSGGDYHGCVRNSTPATPEEYAPLASELTSIGYELNIKKRATRAMHQKCMRG